MTRRHVAWRSAQTAHHSQQRQPRRCSTASGGGSTRAARSYAEWTPCKSVIVPVLADFITWRQRKRCVINELAQRHVVCAERACGRIVCDLESTQSLIRATSTRAVGHVPRRGA